LEGPLQTNQRAELTAVLRALETVPQKQNIHIVSDSNYSINCVTSWYKNWKRNGWKTSTGGPVINQDLVKAIRKLIDDRDAKGAKTDFEWIKGHSNDPGNEAVDILAKNGARANRV
jgi:ribonuclease HI